MTDSTSGTEFKLNNLGLHVCENGSWRRVSDRIRVTAFAREEQRKDLLAVLRFRDSENQAVELILPRSELLRVQPLIAKLVDRGFRTPSDPKDERAIVEFLKRTEPTTKLMVVSRTGWIEGAFVRRERTVGNKGANIRYVPYGEGHTAPECGGELIKWRRRVADPAVHSTRLTFAIALSFATLLQKACGIESGVFHLYEASSQGKTLLLAAARSVHGRARRSDLTHWDVTLTGLEEQASAHCDQLLVLDELGHLAEDLGKAAALARRISFKIAAGHGRIRSVFFGRKGNRCVWRTFVLSSGEVGISQLARAAGTRRLRGDEVRLIDLPASRPGGHGVFDSVPSGQRDARKIVASIEEACGQHFGHPSVNFIERFTATTEESMKAVRAWQADFMAKVPENGWEQRFAKRFALVYAAGRLARRFGLVSWPSEWIKRAIRTCYDDARAAVPDHETMLIDAIDSVRSKLRSRRRVVDLRVARPNERQVRKAAGFIKRDDRHGTYFVVKRDAVQKWIGDRISLGAIATRLREQGYLISTNRKIATKQVQVLGVSGKQRYVCLKRSFALGKRR